jgi:hypothetical protein
MYVTLLTKLRFLSQQKIFTFIHGQVYILMANLFYHFNYYFIIY